MKLLKLIRNKIRRYSLEAQWKQVWTFGLPYRFWLKVWYISMFGTFKGTGNWQILDN